MLLLLFDQIGQRILDMYKYITRVLMAKIIQRYWMTIAPGTSPGNKIMNDASV